MRTDYYAIFRLPYMCASYIGESTKGTEGGNSACVCINSVFIYCQSLQQCMHKLRVL